MLVSTASVTNETTRWGNTDIRNDITVSIELVSSTARIKSVKSAKSGSVTDGHPDQ